MSSENLISMHYVLIQIANKSGKHNVQGEHKTKGCSLRYRVAGNFPEGVTFTEK